MNHKKRMKTRRFRIIQEIKLQKRKECWINAIAVSDMTYQEKIILAKKMLGMHSFEDIYHHKIYGHPYPYGLNLRK